MRRHLIRNSVYLRLLNFNILESVDFRDTYIWVDLHISDNCYGFKLNFYDTTNGANVYLGSLFRYYWYLITGDRRGVDYSIQFSINDDNFGYPYIGTLNVADFKRRFRNGRTIQAEMTYFGDSGSTVDNRRVTVF